ncbi:MAG: ComEC/Rec2 family competence protein, partial [Rikenellaceae bacterium]
MREELELIPFLKIFTTLLIGTVISMIVPLSVSLAALCAIPLPLLLIRKYRTIACYALLFLLGVSLPYLQGPDDTPPLNKNREVIMIVKDSTVKEEILICQLTDTKETILAIFKNKPLYMQGDSIRATILPEELLFAHYTMKKLAPDKKTKLCAKVISHELIAHTTGEYQPKIPLTKRINKWCVERIERLNISPSDIGIINGMLLGNREQIDKERQQQYNNTGISHMLSISGMHISIIFMILNLLFIFRNNSYAGRLIGSLVIIVIIWFYTLVVGAPISALRATIMFTLLQVSIIRIFSPLQVFNTLFATATLFLLIDYRVLLDIGFQLSFLSLLS